MEEEFVVIHHNPLEKLNHVYTIYISGKVGTGKTTVIQNIIKNKNVSTTVFTGLKTPEYESQQLYSNKGVNDTIKTIRAHYNERYYNTERDLTKLVCFDNVDHHNIFGNSDVISLLQSGNYMGTSVIFSSIQPDIPKHLVDFLDYVILFKNNSLNYRLKVSRLFGYFDPKQFNEKMDSLQDHEFIFIDLRNKIIEIGSIF